MKGRRRTRGRLALTVAAVTAEFLAALALSLFLGAYWAFAVNGAAAGILLIVIAVADCDGGYKAFAAIFLLCVPFISTISIILLIAALRRTRPRGNVQFVRFDGARYFNGGEEFYADLLQKLNGAERRIYLEYYAIKNGKVWESVKNVLVNKAEMGLDVRLSFDSFGSLTMPQKLEKWLKSHKIKCFCFNRLSPRPDLYTVCRTHRKIAVADGSVYIGGINLADEYANDPSDLGYWKDCGLRLDGSAADIFAAEILKSYGETADLKSNAGLYAAEAYFDGPFDGSHAKDLIAALLYGEEEIRISTPYFSPDRVVNEALKYALASGKTVRIYLPAVPDKRFVYAASLAFAERFADLGAEVYRFTPGFLHAKLCLAGDRVIIGSSNLDYRSFYLQHECGILTNCTGIVSAARRDLDEIERASEKITVERSAVLTRRILKKLKYIIFKVLAPIL